MASCPGICARRMLFEYVERKRKESSGAQLHVTYLLAGDLLHDGHLVRAAGTALGTSAHSCAQGGEAVPGGGQAVPRRVSCHQPCPWAPSRGWQGGCPQGVPSS